MVNTESIEIELIASIRPTLCELVSIWDYVGYSSEERTERLHMSIQYIQKTLEEVIAEENEIRMEMEQRIETKRREVADLCQQLRIPAYLPQRGLTSSELMKNLEQKSTELRGIKRDRCSQYVELRSRVLRLSELLSEPADKSLKRVANFPQLTPLSPTDASGDKSITRQLSQSPLGDPVSYDRIPEEREIKALADVRDELNALYLPLAEQHAALRKDIGRIAAEIEYEPQSDRERDVLQGIGLVELSSKVNPAATPGVVRKPTDTPDGNDADGSDKENASGVQDPYEPIVDEETLKWLTDWRLRLVKEKARLVGTCEELRAYLTTMWRRLDKPPGEQTEFLKMHGGFKPEDLEALQEEVDRCQQMKWEKLETYLNRLATEAMKLAKNCCVDDAIIQLPDDQDSGDPEVMANHLENVLEQLTQTYAQHRPIYDSIASYEELWQSLQEIEIRLKDPAIFSNRGGILLKTEKEKKRLVKEVQRAEQEVQSAIEQYEAKNNTTFSLSDGRTFKQYVTDRWSSGKTSRETSRPRRSVFGSPNTRTNSTAVSNLPGAPT
ncbi:Protein regulator of cytokinesis [Fasciola hepatica]|uniref:Protein regulator of cytokinesis n=1 Tax=Fasciola hepatica TaxID=6192 RepID=A0A4E0S104_FASHE|nr:Protein regulator of cytokinesis [Fasciola hepatica]